MALDRTTDAIAHFVGAFHLDVEALRLRETYDAFRFAQRADAEQGALLSVKLSVRAPYNLDGFDPRLKAMAPPPPSPTAGPDLIHPAGLPGLPGLPAVMRTEMPAAPRPEVLMPGPGTIVPSWYIPLPNSIATVTKQTLTLSDNDVLSFDLEIPFLPPEYFAARLEAMVAEAEALSLGLAGQMAPGYVPTTAEAQGLADDALAALAPPPAEAKVTILRGEEAIGTVVVNGAAAEEMPDFRENAPAGHFAPPEDEAEEGEEEAQEVLPPDLDPGPNPWAVDPGHNVVTGHNLSANEAFVVMSWVDAGVIAVAGDYVRLDIISQVNVVADRDSGGGAGDAVTQAINAASIMRVSSTPVEEENEDGDDGEESGEEAVAAEAKGGGEAAGGGAPVLPAHWQVVTVEGDVVLMNYIEQHIFAADHDRAELVFTAKATAIGMGDNLLGNLATLLEYGFHYDLIIIGGSMISINVIEQINVLLDNDCVTMAEGAWGLVDTGGNYLQNSATIKTTGIDTVTGMDEAFRAEAEAFAEGKDGLSKSVAQSEHFEGKAALSVLHITGDLVKINVVKQVNVVGDADQVHLAMQEFIAGMDDEITISTGANALLNDARIIDVGLDSTVHVGGEIYTDALIHQAELIDTDAAPKGVSLAGGLASEAVAFLASDMIEAPAEPEAGVPAPQGADSGSLDVMQAVLA